MFSKEQITEYLNKKKSASFLEIARYLKVGYSDNRNLSLLLNEMKDDCEIAFSKKNDCYYIPELIGNYNGIYKVNSMNKGFSVLDINGAETRVSIISRDISPLKGDEININVYKSFDSEFYFGIITSITKRNNQYIFAQVDDKLDIKPLFFTQEINLEFNKSNLEKNTFVKFRIIEIHKNKIKLQFDQTISKIDKPYSDIELMIEQAKVKRDFPESVIDESNKLPNEVENEKKFNRVDLTDQLIITIDGEKTKDFDDAISVKRISDDVYELGVHIADVAYYIKEDSELDIEARERGTSIYLIDKVIPMLPEKLSNGICSLNPNVKRFTLSLVAEIDKKGNVISKKIFPSMIESKYRLTYNQVANMENEEFIKDDDELFNMLKIAYELSDILAKKKAEEGYIDFEIQEPIIELDKKTGKAIAIKTRERLSSEILIENFMVFANETVSETISNLGIPSIYRIHEAPSIEKFESLKSFIRNLGISDLKAGYSKDPKMFQQIVNRIKATRFDNLVKMALLQTMQKAKYSSNNIGHFGLASKYYSHFTSPIRRYPDLLLHRIIWEVIIKGNKNYSVGIKNKIDDISSKSSQAEVKATELERNVNDIKKAEYYENLINSEKDAIIVSIHRFGIFVEFEDMTNSLIHISTLSGDFREIKFDENQLQIAVKNKIYRVGQKVRVKIVSTNKFERKIDSILVD